MNASSLGQAQEGKKKKKVSQQLSSCCIDVPIQEPRHGVQMTQHNEERYYTHTRTTSVELKD
ncbi:unnamed protein product [Dovyalis caffra]|uniref:Uncharacterized protein n=1 Tax=Dovyalis caffra TaxID=77055 RepID=A0AAV1QLU9_9ROSI|nr:unnamed protein product [Dovyalis caffra]